CCLASATTGRQAVHAHALTTSPAHSIGDRGTIRLLRGRSISIAIATRVPSGRSAMLRGKSRTSGALTSFEGSRRREDLETGARRRDLEVAMVRAVVGGVCDGVLRVE